MPGLPSSPGVDKIVENIGKLPPDVLAETCQQILSHLQGQAMGVDSTKVSDRFNKCGIQIDHGTIQEAVRFLMLTFRSARESNLSADVLVTKMGESSTKWPEPALQVVHRLWSEQGTLVQTHQEPRAMLSIGQLVDMQWKLGMALSSDTCRSLNSPYISLMLKIVDISGQISQRSFEMTIQQFENFYRQFKEMAAVLETV
ncbi:hypothetical protein DPEC_G00044180 [Dallia pectoralis]|uniref:Uncharacterized protein n=1 Tax=Dallia pectoralis TaxID=75939 RepID=A0ACC2HA07_DALPE|nr:hypothetical protein DPEC_G00044180 [Dallia pectoralis]